MSEKPTSAIPSRPRDRQPHLFVSYSRADRLAIDRLYDDLTRAHYHLWVDVNERGIEAGEDWRQELERQVSEASAVLACVSPDFLKSPYCRAEIEQARREGKPVYPVIVRRLSEADDLESFGLGHLQYVDLTYGEQAYTLGLRRLRSVLPRPPFPAAYYAARLLRALLVVLAGVGVFLMGMATMWRVIEAYIPPPSVASADVGVAVAQFSAGSGVSAEEARALSLSFSSLLKQELTASITPLSLSLGFLGPEVVGAAGDDLEALARRYGAKIVVYGDITRGAADQLEVTPRFFADPRAFSDVAEIVGAQRLGSAIRLGSAADSLATRQTLTARTTALTYVIVGLTKYTSGDYEGARDSFAAALAQPDLTVAQGGQAVRVLLGSTHLKLASTLAQGRRFDEARAEIAQARAEYEAVRQAAPEYARTYIGLAAAAYLEWNLAGQVEGAVAPRAGLEQALAYIDQAERSQEQPHFVFQIRALFARLQIEYSLWAYYAPDEYPPGTHDALLSSFRSLAARIISAYDGGRSPALADVAAEAYAYQGLAFYGLNDCRSAIPEFAEAAAISRESARIMTFSGWLGDCYAETNQTEAAIRAYTRARDLARLTEGLAPETAAQYQARLDALQSRS